jgi:hypothetical protein
MKRAVLIDIMAQVNPLAVYQSKKHDNTKREMTENLPASRMCSNCGNRFLTGGLMDDIVMTNVKFRYRIIVRRISRPRSSLPVTSVVTNIAMRFGYGIVRNCSQNLLTTIDT